MSPLFSIPEHPDEPPKKHVATAWECQHSLIDQSSIRFFGLPLGAIHSSLHGTPQEIIQW